MSSRLAFNVAAFDGPKFSLYICPAAMWALLKITSLVSLGELALARSAAAAAAAQ